MSAPSLGTGNEPLSPSRARRASTESEARPSLPRLALVGLVPIVVSLLACSGLADTSAGLGDTGGELIVPVATQEGAGDGAPASPAKRPSLQDKIAKVPHKRPARPAGGGKGSGPAGATPTEDPEDDDDAAKPEPGPEEPEGLRGVKQVNPHAWTVRQKVADRWEDDPYDLASVESHGDGWMLRKVRKKDAYHLGMRNKDIILSVNGRKLKTQAQLLAAYLALKNKTDFEVVFLRKGKQMKHTYKIK